MKKWPLLFAFMFIALSSFSYNTKPSRVHKSITSVSRSLIFPVAGSNSSIKDLWGASRGGGVRRHKGIDIHARRGTPVVAICDGVIVEKDHTLIGGKTLWLQSGEHGWKAYYAHLDKQYVREGQYVTKGQVIGTIGNTGNARSTPAHLHFRIAGSKGWVNPYPYVKHATKIKAAKHLNKKSATKRSSRRR